MTAVCLTKLSGRDFRVLIFILGQTDGYHRAEDKIKPTFFSERTGLDKSNIRVTIARLRKLNMIAKNGHFYAVLPPGQWDKAIFVESQMRINIDALLQEIETKKRIESNAEPVLPSEQNRIGIDAPTASILMRQELGIDAVLASTIENPTIENPSIENSPLSNKGEKGPPDPLPEKRPKPSPEAGELAHLLKSHILRNNPKAKTPDDVTKWAIDIDRMLNIDRRTLEEIKFIIQFSQKDSFWCANILSAGKLREKFDQLYLRAKEKEKSSAEKKEKGGSDVKERRTSPPGRGDTRGFSAAELRDGLH